MEDAGAEVEVVGIETGEAQTMNSDVNPGESFTVEKTFSEVSADDYDALIVPGGTVGADNLRGNAEAVGFVRSFFEQEKPAGVICHGPWTLVEADVVKGRTLTSYPTLQTDIRNAGGGVGGRGSRHGPGSRHEPQPRRPGSVLRQDRRGVRRGQTRRAGPERLRTRRGCQHLPNSGRNPPQTPEVLSRNHPAVQTVMRAWRS